MRLDRNSTPFVRVLKTGIFFRRCLGVQLFVGKQLACDNFKGPERKLRNFYHTNKGNSQVFWTWVGLFFFNQGLGSKISEHSTQDWGCAIFFVMSCCFLLGIYFAIIGGLRSLQRFFFTHLLILLFFVAGWYRFRMVASPLVTERPNDPKIIFERSIYPSLSIHRKFWSNLNIRDLSVTTCSLFKW